MPRRRTPERDRAGSRGDGAQHRRNGGLRCTAPLASGWPAGSGARAGTSEAAEPRATAASEPRRQGGVARDALMTWCEAHAVDFVFGLTVWAAPAGFPCRPAPWHSSPVAARYTHFPALLSAADADAMIRLCERFGSYGMYGQKPIEEELGRGLYQRHDAAMNYIRTGGRFGRQESFDAARGAHQLLPRDLRLRPSRWSTASRGSSGTRTSSPRRARSTTVR